MLRGRVPSKVIMGEILLYLGLVAVLVLPDLLSPYLKARYAWQDLRARDELEKRFDRLLRRAGLAPYTHRRSSAGEAVRRRRDPEVWNRPVDSVDRSDGIDSIVPSTSDRTDRS